MATRNAKTIQDYIRSQNMSAQFFTAAGGQGWWRSSLMPAKYWEEDYGITTVEQLEQYLDDCAKPSLSDQIYFYYQEMEEAHKKERIEEKIRQKDLKRKYVSVKEKPLTFNPFEGLQDLVSNANAKEAELSELKTIFSL